MDDLIVSHKKGLYCPVGDFYIDPWGKTKTAIITHAHADHLRPGSKTYICSKSSEPLIKQRLSGSKSKYETISYDFRTPFEINGVTITLHPSGHILGSAQVRLEYKNHVTVLTGDYKLQEDPTCKPFEPLKCDTLITEATFGLPIYKWKPSQVEFDNLWNWIQRNKSKSLTSKLFGYSLGKTQRILAEIAKRNKNEIIYIHGALSDICDIYRDLGVTLPRTELVVDQPKDFDFSDKIVVSPPSAMRSNYMKRFKNYSSAFVSGWSRVRGRRRMGGYDHGFVISDHVDFPGLVGTVKSSNASEVHIAFTESPVFVKYLREELGYENSRQYDIRFTSTED